ncbi:MAG: hypothetical protein IJM59_10440 [Proteobacteria bacterium]|nr:hypothetical protein [Pseudomonadota bacterium]
MSYSEAFINAVLGCIPFIILILAVAKVNLPREIRARQVIMPVIAVIYCISAMIGLVYIQSEVLRIAGRFLASNDPIDANTVNAFVIFVTNSVFVLGFLILKSILLPLLKKYWANDKLMEQTAYLFYEMVKLPKTEDAESEQQAENSEDNHKSDSAKDNSAKKNKSQKKDKKSEKKQENLWVLKNQFDKYRYYFGGFYLALLAVSTIIFILSQIFTEWPVFGATFYPAFGILILGETWFFLSGPERPEIVEKPEEPKREVPVSEFDFLRKILRKQFPERLLYDEYTPGSPELAPLPVMIQDNTCPKHIRELADAYFNCIEGDLNENYIASATRLLQGQSVLISTPFYRDLSCYLMLPMLYQIMSFHKCLIIVGRESAVHDVKTWLDNAINDIVGTRYLWQTEILTAAPCEADIGILSASDIYRMDLQLACESFLNKVGFILLIEPSRILSAGQLGLSLIVNRCESDDKKLTFCTCDRNCDGLVDVLSHVFKTNITEVTATLSGTGCISRMYWKAEGPSMHYRILPTISHYLGLGTELGVTAFRNRVQPVTWISCEKFPVLDMKWIDGQYFKPICSYSGFECSQDVLNENFLFETNLWHDAQSPSIYMTIEDEFQNLFEITRVFSSRATRQAFINVISENYFLRDYMIANVSMFADDPKAIPTFMPAFTRTRRNAALKLLMMMSHGPVADHLIKKEFALMDIPCEDASLLGSLKELIQTHCHIDKLEILVSHDDPQQDTDTYRLADQDVLRTWAESLKPAYFIPENETDSDCIIGTRLYGHVFQSFLPGQFMTHTGKYYQIQTITPQNGVVLRRAADHISGRLYYRQIRKIQLKSWTPDVGMASSRSMNHLEMTRGFGDFEVQTPGYLEMHSCEDMKHARYITINGIPDRHYQNKYILRIRLFEATEAIRYTICLLLNEIFRTTYPDSYQYISALTQLREVHPDNLKNAMYDFEVRHGEDDDPDDYIYILEDSEIDLGLTSSVERNLGRYFDIICDVLMWHNQKTLETPSDLPKAEEEVQVEEEPVEEPDPEPVVEEKKSLWQRIIEFIKSLFGIKPPEPVAPIVEEEPVTVTDVVPKMDFPDDDSIRTNIPQTPYQSSNFLLFGDDHYDEALAIDETIAYLISLGHLNNPLGEVRKYAKNPPNVDDLGQSGIRCECCALPVTFDNTGSNRFCRQCADSHLTTYAEMMEVVAGVQRNLERLFDMHFAQTIHLRTATEQSVTRWHHISDLQVPRFSIPFGYGLPSVEAYVLYVEKFLPRRALIMTAVHELTRLWIEDNASEDGNPEALMDQITLQYLQAIGEFAYAERLVPYMVSDKKCFEDYKIKPLVFNSL